METIKIKNCNNIIDADISILTGALNIKFGFNQAGKSTVSKVIRFKTLGDVRKKDNFDLCKLDWNYGKLVG